MRLINADKFKQQIAAMAIRDNLIPEKCNAICKLIDEQPTAYDVEKVIEDLEELRDGTYDIDCCPYKDTDISCDKCHMIKAIDIVRRGGDQA